MIRVYAFYDSKAEEFMSPWYARTAGEALREFKTLVNKPEHHFSQYPEDFSIFELGEWESKTAKFTMYPAPKSLGIGLEYKNQQIPHALDKRAPGSSPGMVV